MKLTARYYVVGSCLAFKLVRTNDRFNNNVISLRVSYEFRQLITRRTKQLYLCLQMHCLQMRRHVTITHHTTLLCHCHTLFSLFLILMKIEICETFYRVQCNIQFSLFGDLKNFQHETARQQQRTC